MEFWKTVKASLPFVIGVLVGGGFSRNKYIWLILVVYVILMFALRLFAGKATDIKKAADKKIALRNAGMEAVNGAADYISEGHSFGGKLFDKLFPMLSIFIGILMVALCSYFIIKQAWFFASITIFALFNYIVLTNIWRKVKYLGGDDLHG